MKDDLIVDEELIEVSYDLMFIDDVDQILKNFWVLLNSYNKHNHFNTNIKVGLNTSINNGVLEGELNKYDSISDLINLLPQGVCRADVEFDFRGYHILMNYENYSFRDSELEEAIEEQKRDTRTIRQLIIEGHPNYTEEDYDLMAYYLRNLNQRFGKAMLYVNVSKINCEENTIDIDSPDDEFADRVTDGHYFDN